MRRPLLGFLDYTPPVTGTKLYIDRALYREPNLWTPGKKPIGPVKIDWDHPLTTGLRFATLFEEAPDLVSKTPVTRVNSATLEISSYGRGSNNNITSGSAQMTFTPLADHVPSPNDSYAVFILVDIEGFDYTGTEYHIFSSDDNQEGSFTLYTEGDGTTLKISWRAPGTTFNYFQVIGSVVSTGSHSFGIIRKGKNIAAYIDGLWENDFTIVNDFVSRQSTYGFGGGGVSKVERNVVGTYLAAYIWKRMPDFSMSELHNDPYQFLIPA